MSSPISFGGLVSGLPTEDLIKQLMALEQRPLLSLQRQQAQLVAKQSAWQLVRGQLQGVMGKLDNLRFTSGFEARRVTVADDKVLKATVSATATPGDYHIDVQSVAQAHAVASAVFASDSQALGLSGSLSLNGREIQLTAGDSLNSLRQRINAVDGLGVRAAVIQTAPGAYQLVLTSTKLGAAGQISFNHVTTDNDAFTVQVNPGADVGNRILTVTSPAAAASLTGDAEAAAQNGVLSFALNGTNIGELSILAGETAQDVARRINEVYRGLLQAETDDNNHLVVRTVATGSGQSLALTDTAGFGLGATATGADAVYTLDGVDYTSAKNELAVGGVTIAWNDDVSGPQTLNLGIARDNVLAGLGLADPNTGVALTELTAARDAVVKVNGLTVTRDSNTLQNVLPGLNLTLTAVGETRVTVAEDTQAIVAKVKDFVDTYNKVAVDFYNRMYFKPDPVSDALAGGGGSTKKADILQGESLLRQMHSDLRRLVSNPVMLGDGQVYSLADIGITTVGWGDADFYAGKLQIDSEKLTKVLTEQPGLVQELFGAKTRNVALGGTVTVLGPDDQPLTDLVPANVYGAANLTNGITDPSFWGLPGGGWQSPVTGPVTVEIAVNAGARLDSIGVHMLNSAQYPAAQYALSDFEVQYWNGTAWATAGQPVTDNKSGYVRVDLATPIQTDKIRIVVTGTNDPDGYARLLHVDATQVNDGAAQRLHRHLRDLTSVGGVLDERAKGSNSLTRDLDDRIRMMEYRLEKREETLRRQFNAMESALARLSSQSSWLASQLSQLMPQR